MGDHQLRGVIIKVMVRMGIMMRARGEVGDFRSSRVTEGAGGAAVEEGNELQELLQVELRMKVVYSVMKGNDDDGDDGMDVHEFFGIFY